MRWATPETLTPLPVVHDHVFMDSANITQLQHAIERINSAGDIEPFVGLMSPDMTWSGAPEGWLWRRFTPS